MTTQSSFLANGVIFGGKDKITIPTYAKPARYGALGPKGFPWTPIERID